MKFINKEGKVFDTIKVADDDYTFTVKLCDNEIDDDNERFSSQCLWQKCSLGSMVVLGKPESQKLFQLRLLQMKISGQHSTSVING